MWKVFIINADGSKKQIYSNRYMPTTDDMAVVYAVRGKAFEEAVLADEAIAGAIAAHGYPKVLRYLNRHIRLL